MLLLLKCINEECGKIAPRDASWRKSKVVLNADICKKCFDEEVRALRLDDDSDDLDEDEEERKEETKGNENNDNNNNKTDKSEAVHDLNKERAKAKREKRKEIAKLGMKSCAACASKETTAGWYRSHVKKGVYL